MSPSMHTFISLDLPAMLAGTFAALACGLLGNFLVLRKISLMGDAISHAVLPGLVAAFLITGQRATLPMFLGAAGAGVATVAIVEGVRRFGRVESGAAMGVTFSVLFALGVLLIEQAAARHVDLDPDCVLHGMLETVFWTPPMEWSGVFTWETLAELPRQVTTTGAMALVAAVFVVVFFKELRISAFDPGLATALGFSAIWMHFMLMVLVAAATVASFEAVGSILVIAMLICPAATARLLTDRLSTQVWMSAVLAVIAGVGGYLLGAFGPQRLGFAGSVSVTGMMTVVSGGLLALAVFFSPTHGVLARLAQRARLSSTIAREDMLGLLFRLEELGQRRAAPVSVLVKSGTEPRAARRALRAGVRRGEMSRAGEEVSLTEAGRRAASSLVRSHRLWETYLVSELGLRPDHVHDTAMRLEHITRGPVAEKLETIGETAVDPHERPIPPAM